MAQLKESASNHQLCDIEVVREARKLDRETLSLLNTLALRHKISGESEEKHSSLPATRSWNTLQMVRVDMNDLVATHGTRGLLSTPEGGAISKWLTLQVRDASEIIRISVEEICESVPPFLRGTGARRDLMESTSAWICSLIWPLAHAAATHMLTLYLHQRVRCQLKTFAEIAENPRISRVALEVAQGQSAQDRCAPYSGCEVPSLTQMAEHIFSIFVKEVDQVAVAGRTPAVLHVFFLSKLQQQGMVHIYQIHMIDLIDLI
jgi:hypothetical protein